MVDMGVFLNNFRCILPPNTFLQIRETFRGQKGILFCITIILAKKIPQCLNQKIVDLFEVFTVRGLNGTPRGDARGKPLTGDIFRKSYDQQVVDTRISEVGVSNHGFLIGSQVLPIGCIRLPQNTCIGLIESPNVGFWSPHRKYRINTDM